MFTNKILPIIITESPPEYKSLQYSQPEVITLVLPEPSPPEYNTIIQSALNEEYVRTNLSDGCCGRDAPDMRCCGLAHFCPDPNKEGCCYATMKLYYKSICWATGVGPACIGGEEDMCCTICFLPIKIPLCLPCLLGTMFNSIINYYRGTKHNYLL